MFSSFLSSRFFSIIGGFLSRTKENNMIIDPLSCMIKISILNFRPVGTKLCVMDNGLVLHDPTFYQGPLRSIYGVGREDLHNLCKPIQKCVDWFLQTEDREMNYLSGLATRGLQRLLSTYSSNCTIKYTIEYYINIIEEKTLSKDYSPENRIHTFLQELWTKREIHIVIEMLKELELKFSNEDYQEEMNNLMASILTITESKENKFHKFLVEYSSVL